MHYKYALRIANAQVKCGANLCSGARDWLQEALTGTCRAEQDWIDPQTGEPVGPLDGLIYIPAEDCHAGLFLFSRDSACPLWDEYAYASALMAAEAGLDGMWTDNFSAWDSLGSPPVRKAFGDWSVASFRTHLEANSTPSELASMGVTSISTFDIREWLKTRATNWGWAGANLGASVWRDSRWLDEPLWRAYMIFKRQAGTEALSNYYAAVKSAAAGKPDFLVCGNDIPVFSMGWVRGNLDLVSTEVSTRWNLCSGSRGFMIPPIGRLAPFYKLAREHGKSRLANVWLHRNSATLGQANVASLMYYEMLAAHTLPMLHPSDDCFAGTPEANRSFFEFVEQAAPTFSGRTAVEEIGVYYSWSSILADYTPGGYLSHSNQAHQFAHWGWATALGNLHLQYRPLPEWKLTPDTLAGLRALVLPESIVFDDADVAGVLTPWVQAGGRLIVTGVSGRRLGEDDNFDLAPSGYTLRSLTAVSNVASAPPTVSRPVGQGLVHYIRDNIGLEYFNASTTRSALLPQFASAVDMALAGSGPALLTPGAGVTEAVGLTTYEDAAS